MRRKDREITDPNHINTILQACDVCRLGLTDNGVAYIVPLSFGFEQVHDTLTLYFHSAKEGRKLDLIRQNNQVAFELDTAHQLFGHPTDACGFGMRYQSIMGVGTAHILQNEADKRHGFDCIMAHYTDQKLPYGQSALQAAVVIAVTVQTLSCKVHE